MCSFTLFPILNLFHLGVIGNVPLLIPVGPVQRSPVGQLNKQFHPYVDPTTYEDPYEALDMFSIELPAHVIEVTRVIGSGEFGEVCCGRLTAADTYGNTQVCTLVMSFQISC